MSLLLYFVLMTGTMMALARLLPGFHVADGRAALVGAVVLGLVHTLVKPVLFVLTLPFTIVTLGLFLFVLNMLMLWLAAALVPGFDVHGVATAFVASVVIALVGMLWKALARGK